MPKSFSRDGRWLVFLRSNIVGGSDPTGNDIAMLDMTGDQQLKPLIHTRVADDNGAVSPDGHWLAYESAEPGRREIFVRPFPAVDSGRLLISPNGGTRAVWSRDGRELFYLEPPGRLMVVAVQPGASFSASRPQLLFDKPYALPTSGWTYDVSPDGRQFLMMKSADETELAPAPTNLVVVQNFGEELKRLVPIKN